jgi:hypothetical protein
LTTATGGNPSLRSRICVAFQQSKQHGARRTHPIRSSLHAPISVMPLFTMPILRKPKYLASSPVPVCLAHAFATLIFLTALFLGPSPDWLTGVDARNVSRVLANEKVLDFTRHDVRRGAAIGKNC